MELLTPRLRIDALHQGDAAALFACRADPQVALYQGWVPANLGEVEAFIDRQSKVSTAAPDGWFQRAVRLRDTGVLVGDIGVCLPSNMDAPVEFGISLSPRWQGCGYANEALRALLEWVFRALGRRRVQASVDPRNVASVAMLRALGMRQEAHHRESLRLRGEWVDDMIFAMLAREWPSRRASGAHRG